MSGRTTRYQGGSIVSFIIIAVIVTAALGVGLYALRQRSEQARIGFVAPNSVSLAQAHYEPWWQPYGLYAAIDGQETMVGFVMVGRWPMRAGHCMNVPCWRLSKPVSTKLLIAANSDRKRSRTAPNRNMRPFS